MTLREAAQAVAERMLREHEIDLAVAVLEAAAVLEAKAGSGIRCDALLKLPMVLLVEASSPGAVPRALTKISA